MSVRVGVRLWVLDYFLLRAGQFRRRAGLGLWQP